MAWEHRDVSNASIRGGAAAELDPLGMNAGVINPFPYHSTRPALQEARTYPGFADMMSGSQCHVDGIDYPCSMINGEATLQCPDNDCGPRTMTLTNADGEHKTILSNPFRAYSDGWSGFTPAGTTYVGDGMIFNSWWTGGGSEKVKFDDIVEMTSAWDFASYFQGNSNNNSRRTKRKKRGLAGSGSLAGMRSASVPPEIEIISTGGDTEFARHKSEVIDFISRIANPDGPCAAAFKRAGLPTPGDILNKGLIIGPRLALRSSAYDEALGIPDAVREKYNQAKGSALTVLGSSKGKPIILFAGESFNDYEFMEDIPHEFIHIGGIGNQYQYYIFGSIPVGHDLLGYKPYKDIIKNCQ